MRTDRQSYSEYHESAESLRESDRQHYPPRTARRSSETGACWCCEQEFDAVAIDGGLCPNCKEREATCEGCGKLLPLGELEQTYDGALCDVCLYGYKRTPGVAR